MMQLPFENDTNKVIRRLAKRSLEADQRRNLFIIVTIALAVCLMGIVFFGVSAQQAQTLEQLRGQYQAGCVNMSRQDITRLVDAGKFEKYGYEAAEEMIRYQDSNLLVNFQDPGMLKLKRWDTITGTYPVAANEICVERAFLQYFQLPVAVGDAIQLDLGQGEQTYLISGITEKENTSRMFYVLISEAAIEASGTENPYVLRFRFIDSQIDTPDQLRADIAEFFMKMGIPEDEIFYSSNYFDLTSLYMGGDGSIYSLALFIAFACAIVIYSIFYISVVNKMREYGRLKVLGATSRQLKGVVKRERRLLTMIALPAGLLLAALLVNLWLPGYWNWADNLQYVLYISILTELVVLLATRKPLQLVGKVAAIEAIRTTAYTKSSQKEHSKKLHRHLTIPRLAFMNFSRNPKTAVITMLSLGLTGVMAICIAAFFSSVDVQEMAKAQFGDGGDYLLTFDNYTGIGADFIKFQQEEVLSARLVQQLRDLSDVEQVTVYKAVTAELPQAGNKDKRMELLGLTKEQMQAKIITDNLLEGTADYDDLLENNGIVIVKSSENLLKNLYQVDFAIGDKVTFTSFYGQSQTYTVRGIIDDMVHCGISSFFILPEPVLQELYPDVHDFTASVNIHVTEENTAVRQQIFDTVTDPRIQISSINDMVKHAEQSMQKMKPLLYGLLCFIFLFALINLVNTLITNLLTRQREFGILQAVGLSNKQLSQMLSFECLCYIGGTMLITLSIGTICSMWVCQIFNEVGVFGTITYHFPITQILVFAVALLIVQSIFAMAATWSINRQSLVERMKTEV